MSDALTAKNGALWIQKQPGKAAEYLGCADLDPIAKPRGDETLVNCRNADGNVEAVGSSTAPPGAGTTAFKALIYPEANILDELKNCPAGLYALQRTCKRADVFANYVRGYVLERARISSESYENIVSREGDDASLQNYDFSFRRLFKVRELTIARQTIAETRNLNDIVFCNPAQCGDDCGEQKDAGTDGFTVASGGAASPPSDADVWLTTDKGVTWANATGLVPSPFAGGDIVAAVCFPMGRDTTRLLVASGPKAGSAQIAYSDDSGATWSTVTVGSTAWEGGRGKRSLCALDWRHIWFATDHGRVYFSDDGGLTWTSQATALTADAAKALNGVRFVDFDNGWAVGDSDVVLRTVDGGDTWSALTSPTSSDNVTSLEAWSKYRAIVGSNAGEVWETWDAGVSWESKPYTGQLTTDTIKFLTFVSENIGYMAVNSNAPLGSVHRSLDGGASWEKLTTPANAGVNAIEAIDENLAYCIGNAYNGTGFVAKISG